MGVREQSGKPRMDSARAEWRRQRRVKLPLVGAELLHRAHARAGAYDGDHVAGLHLLVDELLERNPHLRSALKGESEIIHDERQRTANLLGPETRWRHERRIVIFCALPS